MVTYMLTIVTPHINRFGEMHHGRLGMAYGMTQGVEPCLVQVCELLPVRQVSCNTAPLATNGDGSI